MTGQRGPAMLTAAQAAELLGVRLTSVYAYVSRGVLSRQLVTDGGHRHSMFVRDEVVALANDRAKPRAGLLDVVVESDVTQLDARGHLSFRGRSVAELVQWRFEAAANFVWELDPADPWPEVAPSLVDAVTRSLPSPADLPHLPDRVRLVLQVAAAHDPHRDDVSAPHVVAAARDALRLAVLAIEPAMPPDAGGVVAQTWRSLTGRPGTDAELEVLNTAMIGMLDHELTASTLAARIAASTHSDPWMALLAGLATMSGPRHGAASSLSERMLDDWVVRRQAPEASPPGFGHKVYDGIDPRAQLVFESIEAHDPELMSHVDQLVAKVASEHSVLPNTDLGLAVLTRWAGMRPGVAETIFMVSRIVGIAAHVIEEYPQGFRFRGRAAPGS